MGLILWRKRKQITPSSISTLVGWYDASVIGTLWQDAARTTPVSANSDPVGAWDDQSASALHLTQGTAGAKPTYKSADVNGKAGLSFDGGDYVFSSAAGVATLYAGVDKPIVVFAVIMLNPTTGTQCIAGIGNSASSVGFRALRTSSGIPQVSSIDDASGSTTNTAAAGDLGTIPARGGWVINTTPTTELFRNGARVYGPLAAETGTFTINRFALGCLLRSSTANFLTGYLSEVVVCTSITPAQILGLNNYLRAKWAP